MKVSVTIPTFNRAHFLGQALDSVFRQSHDDIEAIVVDDGSTDGTRDLVRRYGDRVRYLWQPNKGLGAARNVGLDLATGDCIAFLDSDDYWLHFKLALQVRLLERLGDVAFVFSEFEIRRNDGSVTPRGSRTWLSADRTWEQLYPERFASGELGLATPSGSSGFFVYAGCIYRHFLDEALVLPTTALVRRDALQGLRFSEGMTIFEDWEFFARLARGRRCAFADVETSVNRGHDDPGRLTRCSALAKAECYLQMFERVWKADNAFCSEHPDVVRHAESAALLGVAQAAVLEGRRDIAERALANWRTAPGRMMTHKALTCELASRLPGGKHVLRAAIVGGKLARRLLPSPAVGEARVNPSA